MHTCSSEQLASPQSHPSADAPPPSTRLLWQPAASSAAAVVAAAAAGQAAVPGWQQLQVQLGSTRQVEAACCSLPGSFAAL